MRHCSIIFAVFVLMIHCTPLCAQQIYLMSVGVSDYPGRENDLGLPANDARSICRLYRTNNRVIATLLTDRKATHAEVLTKARILFSKAKEEDIVVFFFSGHGFPGGFATYDEPLFYHEIRQLFAACRARNKMIFADACFAGDMREDRRGKPDPGHNVLLFLSCRSGEYAIESPRMHNGFFTAALLGALKGGADRNRDRIITARELFDAASRKVHSLSEYGQHPVMWGNFNDNMPVMIW